MRTLNEIETDYIIMVLNMCGGKKTLTAKTLGIGRATLYRKLKEMKQTAKPV